ncbi:MAG: hypothetical protein ACL93V_11940 [Candidatus Electrothrix sp. YB6]
MKNKHILWIEDLEHSVADEKCWCESQGFLVKMVNHPARFAEYLERNKENIRLLILDIMLAGVNNLKTIGVCDSDTLGGREAGWELVRRFLRSEPKSPYAKIPVLIVSARMKSERDDEDIFTYSADGMGEIRYIEKRNPDINWSEQFKNDVVDLSSIGRNIV